MDSEMEVVAHKKIPFWRLTTDHARLTPEVTNHKYDGSGTEEDPYIVTWIHNDPGNPMDFSPKRKWAIAAVAAISTLAVAFNSSAYSGGIRQILYQFHVDTEIATLGISLFVLGFAVGPLIWAPLSEMYGRQLVFIISYGAFTAFNAGAAGSQNITTLLVLRFFAGACGSSPLTNAGGQIADIFSAQERGLAMGLFALAPFLGPTIGPIVGGFLAQYKGWRWVEGLMAIVSGAMWLLGIFLVPETYGPVLLRKRAAKLSQLNSKIYKTKSDATSPVTASKAITTALVRPWILLFREPIVLVLSIYMAIIYGTLYMLFGAFPIVFQQYRGWSEGIGGLAFLGVAVGMVFAVMCVPLANKRYTRTASEYGGFAPPESRLPMAIVGAVAVPVGLFWFSWTNYPFIHWISPIMAGAPFGFGMVLIFLAVTNYLIDAYTIFAASVLAANSVLRSLFGFAFPLFTKRMYDGLGIHWASSIPAFLALACLPAPFLLYKYGDAIRARSPYASRAEAVMNEMRGKREGECDGGNDEEVVERNHSLGSDTATEPTGGEEMDEAIEVKKTQSRNSRRSVGGSPLTYQTSPYDIDRTWTNGSLSGLPR